MLAPHPFSVHATANQVHLRIMETTDLHMHIYPYDYYADKPVDTVGLARTATLIGDIRAEASNTLLLDNGDFLQGNPMGDYIAYERGMKEGDEHPIFTAMNALRFDAATIGNHEFNYGISFLMKSLAGAAFPVVCANVLKKRGATPREDETLLPPYAIIERKMRDGAGGDHLLRIGLIGFVPPQIVNWDRRHMRGNAETRDIIETAKAYIPLMREEGCDLIVALSHSGIGAAEAFDGMENASIPLAGIDGIDAILTGHSHLVFPSSLYDAYPGADSHKGTLMGKPATMGGFWGSHLGLIDLLLEYESGAWRVREHRSESRPIYRREAEHSAMPLVESRPEVLASVKVQHSETLEYIRRPVGKTDAPLHSYFALVADDPSIQIVTNAQHWYVKQMLHGTDLEGLPMLSAGAPFKAGGRGGPEHYTDVEAGDIAIKNVADLCLYPNLVRAVRINGATVKDWLERSAGIFNRIEPGSKDAVLINTTFPSYNFDVIDGVSYQIDVSQPSKYGPDGYLENGDASRIVDLCYQGAPIDFEQDFIVVTNSYRVGGGGHFPGTGRKTTVFRAPDTTRDVVMRYLAETETVSPRADGNWRFSPLPGTSVYFDTGPVAIRYYEEIPDLDLKLIGMTQNGFARFRINL